MECRMCSNSRPNEVRAIPASTFGVAPKGETVECCVNCYMEMFSEGVPDRVAKQMYEEFLAGAAK